MGYGNGGTVLAFHPIVFPVRYRFYFFMADITALQAKHTKLTMKDAAQKTVVWMFAIWMPLTSLMETKNRITERIRKTIPEISHPVPVG